MWQTLLKKLNPAHSFNLPHVSAFYHSLSFSRIPSETIPSQRVHIKSYHLPLY